MNSEEDEKLWQLIVAAKCCPKGSPTWTRSMDRLIVALQRLPEFGKYRYSGRLGELDALNHTWEWLMYHLEEFQPRHGLSIKASFIAWIFGNLKWQLSKKRADFSGNTRFVTNSLQTEQLLSQVSATGRLVGTAANPSISDGIESYIEQLEAKAIQRLVKNLAEYIERDPEHRLKQCFPRHFPQCHCQLLSLRLLFIFNNPPDTLSNIAQEFKINYKTLHWHWTKRGLPLLQEVLFELGYKKNQQL